MKYERSSGILLHPTSLPGPYGIGDIGPQAHDWIDFLAESGCSLWQVLPLGPTGYGDSPYQCFSAFAGNPYIISLDELRENKLLHTNDLIELPKFPQGNIDYGKVLPWKNGVLDRAYIQFERLKTSSPIKREYDLFQQENQHWLEDFALFMALKEAHAGAPWVSWQETIRNREPAALEAARKELKIAIDRQNFRQFIFYRQWNKLREHAKGNNIQIIGDMPIFIAHDSADVWANPELFHLDSNGYPTVVAGVPPDYFSPTGQLWGNPLYIWDHHKSQNYSWWVKRFRSVLNMVDIVRLDHFRGFAGYWQIPGDAPTAETGEWVPGPGKQFLSSIQQALGDLPIIAEDLGVITPDVIELREDFRLPGMKILQFAFSGDPNDSFLPHNYPRNCVVYTGTHDNDTARGWYERVSEAERGFYRRYLNCDGHNVAWDLIRASWASVAMIAIAPIQDFLNLDNSARMNYPGDPSGNWTWQLNENAITEELANRIYDINYLYGRLKSLPKK